MTIEESYATIGDDLDEEVQYPLDFLTAWMENLEGASLDDLRDIRRALGHEVEASEREFLSLLKSRGLLATSEADREWSQVLTDETEDDQC